MVIAPENKACTLAREKQLVDDRSSFDPTYREIREYLLPWHGRSLGGQNTNEDTDGRLKNHKIYDGTATRALGVTAAGMQAGINSPARPWFKLGYADRELSDYKPVRVWLDQVEQILRDIFTKSNFYKATHHSYLEVGAFGTSASAILPSYKSVIRVRPYTVGEYWLGIDDEGVVDTFFRKARWTAKQMVERFGLENVSTAVKYAYNNKNTETRFTVNHFVEPNDQRMKFPFMGDKAYRGLYHEDGFPEDKVLAIGGSQVFPILAPRWHTVGMMTYGFGPGHATLRDIQGLQKEKIKHLVATDKVVDPPMVGPAGVRDGGVNTMPGGFTVDDSIGQNMGLRPVYQINPDINAIVGAMQDTRQAIRQGLFTDLFTMIANSVDVQKTATEVAALKEEKMMVLGPVLDSFHNEHHGPAIDSTFHYAWEAGMLPDPPEEVQGMDMEVEYISILAQAQKLVATSGIEQVAAFVGNLSAVFPEARYKFNATEAIDEYAGAVGVSAKVINSDEEVAAMQQAEQRQQQMAQALEASASTAQQAKVLSDTDLGGNSALNALIGGAGVDV